MKLSTIKAEWDKAARQDAMFNILTCPEAEHTGWDADEFFARGETEIANFMSELDDLGLETGTASALDFGCGVGRLTQPLTRYFTHVIGVDISREMVKQAREHATERGVKCKFWTNSQPNLRLFGDDAFDLIYTVITLQHMPQDYQRRYVQEFIRILKPMGLAAFQLPEGPDAEHTRPWLSMFGTPPDTVSAWIGEAGGQLLNHTLTDHSGGAWKGWRYIVGRAS